MSTVFRVVVVADRHEVLRSPSLFVACARWVKDPDRRRVEELDAGSETVVREVPRNQCCEVLREWIPKIALEHGKASVSLSARAGKPDMSLFDADGKYRVGINLADDGAGLWFQDAQGMPLIWLNAGEQSTDRLWMRGPNGAVGLSLSESGPALLLQDAAGNRVHPIPVKTEQDDGIRGFAPDKS